MSKKILRLHENYTSKSYDSVMGGSSSKEGKNVENSGAVQNNINIGKTMEVHNWENTILLSIICAIKIVEVLIYAYKSFRRNLKRNLSGNNNVRVTGVQPI